MHAVMFRLSSGVTAMNKSASPTPTSFKPFMEVGEAVAVIKSKVGVQCAQLVFVVVHQNDVLLLAGQQFGQVCAYCAGTCNNYFHFLYGNEE